MEKFIEVYDSLSDHGTTKTLNISHIVSPVVHNSLVPRDKTLKHINHNTDLIQELFKQVDQQLWVINWTSVVTGIRTESRAIHMAAFMIL